MVRPEEATFLVLAGFLPLQGGQLAGSKGSQYTHLLPGPDRDAAHTVAEVLLVHAGAGGLGSTVIQLAKYLGTTGATTTGTGTADLVRNLGADVVVD